MNLARALVLGFCLASLAACASPPYAAKGVDRATAMADYQDCYSKGCLAHFTPELKASINKTARACMKERGYQETCSFPWW
ncbi:hypothetical protein NNJEOMEG_00740 [Fundidesulfovibrio magnetotacticus]|uniref:Lipoprotein n=1 Tax=Fundidesulfovibrio magnetotacticus TaxID=2730080 RepID=A0A6V8LJJ8_9BACT|nr:hypothetical protein [Fundidesulfovibrio magnetotacticus]GFK92912.1 hypothetical protein NNJEOMEG_00740 [Fundidesulfovibrio magnetotacticus]